MTNANDASRALAAGKSGTWWDALMSKLARTGTCATTGARPHGFRDQGERADGQPRCRGGDNRSPLDQPPG